MTRDPVQVEPEETSQPALPRQRGIDHRVKIQRAVLVHPARASDRDVEVRGRRLDEAVGLAAALDLEVVRAEVVTLREMAPGTLFGKGRVEALAEACEALEADVLVVDDALSPVQQRNLERALKVKVIDRTGLILEIFARRARTREGKLQVELARLGYERSRLVRTWTHLERQRGGFGVMGGPGETQIETDRRLLASKISHLKDDLKDVRRTRGLHRSARRRTPFPTLALVGYTNAGKSTLFNRLTDARVEAKDMLFATLDPTLRELKLPDGRAAILSDTVGFISDLPHELVEAFRATLEEVEEADFVVHVRDASSGAFESQGRDVDSVLSGLGFEEGGRDPRLIEVWNKIDRVGSDDRAVLQAKASRTPGAAQPPAILVSAASGEGCEDLLRYLAGRVDAAAPVRVTLGSADGEAVAWLYRHGRVLERSQHEDGSVTLTLALEPQALGRLERQFPHLSVEDVGSVGSDDDRGPAPPAPDAA